MNVLTARRPPAPVCGKRPPAPVRGKRPPAPACGMRHAAARTGPRVRGLRHAACGRRCGARMIRLARVQHHPPAGPCACDRAPQGDDDLRCTRDVPQWSCRCRLDPRARSPSILRTAFASCSGGARGGGAANRRRRRGAPRKPRSHRRHVEREEPAQLHGSRVPSARDAGRLARLLRSKLADPPRESAGQHRLAAGSMR